MARNIVPPPDRHGGTSTPGSEWVHPAYDAGLDPETQVFHVYPGAPAQAEPGSPIGPRPGPYMQSLVPRPGRWRGRARTATAALGGGATALVILVSIGAVLGATGPGDDATGGGAPPVSGEGAFTLEAVSGSGLGVSVTYSNANGGTATSSVASGWTTDIPAQATGTSAFTIAAAADGTPPRQDDTVTCRVRRNGTVVRQDTAGGGAGADCSGYRAATPS